MLRSIGYKTLYWCAFGIKLTDAKEWERWSIALFISLAQTLKCNRFWRYTCVISAEVNNSWTELQGKESPPTYTLDKFRARKCIFCTVFPCQICMGLNKMYSYALLTKHEVKMAGYWPSSFFLFASLWTETKSRSIKKLKKNKANIQSSWPNKLGQESLYSLGLVIKGFTV